MTRPSSIKRLEPEFRELIDAALKRGVTIMEIKAKLEGLGVEVSKSAIGRYKLELDQVGERLRRSREIANAFVEKLGAVPDGRQGRLTVELLQTAIFDTLVPRDNGDAPALDTQQILRLSMAVKDLISAEKISADREMRIRADARRQAQEEAASAAEGAAKAKGLSADTAAFIRAQILGIKEDK